MSSFKPGAFFVYFKLITFFKHRPKTLMLILLKTFLHRRRYLVKKLTSGIAIEAGVSIRQCSWHIYILPTELKAISRFFLKEIYKLEIITYVTKYPPYWNSYTTHCCINYSSMRGFCTTIRKGFCRWTFSRYAWSAYRQRVSLVVEKAYWVRYLSRPESARMPASCFLSVGNIDNKEKSRMAKIIKRKCFLVSTKS